MSVLCTRRYAQEIRRLGPELARFLERFADCFARKDRRAHLAVYVDGQPWERYRVKDGEKGPMVWEAKHAMLICPGGDGLPAETLHLLVASHVLDETEIKFFLSNAAPVTSVGQLLLVAFALARGAVLRRSEAGDQPRRLGGASLHRLETSSDPLERQLPVPRPYAAYAAGKKSGDHAGVGRQKPRPARLKTMRN